MTALATTEESSAASAGLGNCPVSVGVGDGWLGDGVFREQGASVPAC